MERSELEQQVDALKAKCEEIETKEAQRRAAEEEKHAEEVRPPSSACLCPVLGCFPAPAPAPSICPGHASLQRSHPRALCFTPRPCFTCSQVEKLKNVNDHLMKSLESLLAPPSKK